MGERATVSIHSTDELSRSGALDYLSGQSWLTIVDPANHSAGISVAVFLTFRVDEEVMVELRRLVREPGRRVVLVTDQLREPELMNVLECGVRSVIWRGEATRARLAKAVRLAASGENQLPSDLLGQLMVHVGRAKRAAARSPSMTVPAFGLAPREVDVLKLLAEGFNTRQIAEKLTYSERTIKSVIYSLLTRLQLRNRAHAVAYALREGYF